VERILADLGYRGTFVKETERRFGFQPTIHDLTPLVRQGCQYISTKEKRAHKKLHGLGEKRWIVERTFAWLGNYRRLTRDYERKPRPTEAMISVPMTQVVRHRQ